MNKTHNVFKKCAAALAVASTVSLFSVGAEAAGLGRLTVFSGLGQPLKAEIEIAASAEELSGMSARLAPDEVFKKSGVEYSYIFSELKFNLVTKGKRTILEISTRKPVNEPFMDLLVELNWPSGRLVREYTFLLDPPEIKKHVARGVRRPATQVALQTDLPPLIDPKTGASSAAMDAQLKKFRGVASPYTPRGQGGYAVQRGDTLRGIAEKLQYANVTTEQMLIAIYKANPHAFVQNNINLLRANVQLKIPTAEEAGAVSEREARTIYARHVSEWNDYRQKLAGIAPSTASASSGQSSGGKITAARPQEKLPSSGLRQDQVRISTTEGGKGRGTAETDRVAQAGALQEAQARVAMLERNVSEITKLLELKNQQIAELQMRSTSSSSELPATEPDLKSLITPEPEPEPELPLPPPEEKKPTPPVEEKKPSPPKPRPSPVPPPIPEPEASFLEENMLLIGAGALALILVGGLAFYKRKKKSSGGNEDEDDEYISASASVLNEAASDAAPISAMSTADSVDSDADVDPLSEAEVYIAYGRDAKAEEVLKAAMEKTPERIALHMRLLELYAKNESRAKFESLANNLRTLTKETGEHWARVLELGQQIDSANPLYVNSVAPSVAPEDGFDIASVPPSVPPEDLGAPSLPPPPQPEINSEPLDFGVQPKPEDSLINDINNAPLDFATSSVLNVSQTDLNLEPPPSPSADAPEVTSGPQYEEAVTKMDLAKAYEEMGDVDGAKELYQELLDNAQTPASIKDEVQNALSRLNA